MIVIKELNKKEDLLKFIKYPFDLYKDSKQWVPPIVKDELNSFDSKLNPVFEHAEARFFVAFKNTKIVGRIAAIINWKEINEQGVKKMRFGWFDFENDFEVSTMLLDKVKEIGNEYQLEFMEGPVGFSNLDKVGIMTYGFEEIGSMITWYNYPYYEKHYTAFGLVKEKEYIESKFPFTNVKPKFFFRIQNIVKERYKLHVKSIRTTKEVLKYADDMFDLFNTSYAKLSSHVAISNSQKEYFKNKFISYINPEYIKFIFDSNDKLVAFAVVLPSFAKALQKANGKVFPFGIFHLLKAKYYSKTVLFYLIGVLPEYQSKGVTGIIFNEYYEEFKSIGIKNCYRTPELADNKAVQQLWKHFEPKICVRRQTMKMNL